MNTIPTYNQELTFEHLIQSFPNDSYMKKNLIASASVSTMSGNTKKSIFILTNVLNGISKYVVEYEKRDLHGRTLELSKQLDTIEEALDAYNIL